MSTSTLAAHAQHLISSIELCAEKGFHTPSLVLIYATVDIMAWLDREEAHEDVQRSDFIKWVETYLLPDSQLPCTAKDLYAARCSLVHSYSAESKLSRTGKASEIYYAFGNGDERDLQKKIDFVGNLDAKAVRFERLLAALKKGVEQFISKVQHMQLVIDRADKFFSFLPALKLDAQI